MTTIVVHANEVLIAELTGNVLRFVTYVLVQNSTIRPSVLGSGNDMLKANVGPQSSTRFWTLDTITIH